MAAVEDDLGPEEPLLTSALPVDAVAPLLAPVSLLLWLWEEVLSPVDEVALVEDDVGSEEPPLTPVLPLDAVVPLLALADAFCAAALAAVLPPEYPSVLILPGKSGCPPLPSGYFAPPGPLTSSEASCAAV